MTPHKNQFPGKPIGHAAEPIKKRGYQRLKIGDSADDRSGPLTQDGSAKYPTGLRLYMFLFPRPLAAVLAAFTTSGMFLLIGFLLQHAGN
jgi:hypothetical protein